jgi:hypothetical protein
VYFSVTNEETKQYKKHTRRTWYSFNWFVVNDDKK